MANDKKSELWERIKKSRSLCSHRNYNEFHTSQDVFSECFDEQEKEIQSLKAENEKLRKCVKFYASEYSWITKMIGVCDLIHEDDLEQLQDSRGIDWNIGGKFARQTLKELE